MDIEDTIKLCRLVGQQEAYWDIHMKLQDLLKRENLYRQMHEYGYKWDGMMPISKEEAVKLFEDGGEVFLLYGDGSESAVIDDLDEILDHDGMFGVEKSGTNS